MNRREGAYVLTVGSKEVPESVNGERDIGFAHAFGVSKESRPEEAQGQLVWGHRPPAAQRSVHLAKVERLRRLDCPSEADKARGPSQRIGMNGCLPCGEGHADSLIERLVSTTDYPSVGRDLGPGFGY